ncbi:uncharacterized protein MYCFIDRAFT_77273 [Pseudocercospora fijiensis CIRAD86]|uniref:2-dehydropantoate 2-reductase n=1 Tax=Pseudocercospora fijiensis (strain CIRAD86) TaxID=383855 RepID=M2ZAS9_PSEFD|nr:uncharacterized protein MYCFIDRAFT_77273 [Pseudocercospora fijiensis CIRAD86]EME86935.1 hypothetical protein MYCFIDRAFT_77273 [Pseudocercospora fijiensis CIRAD86]
MEKAKVNVLLIGGGGVGTVAAVNLEAGGLAEVSMVLRSNYQHVKTHGYSIESPDHGSISGWRPTEVLKNVPNAAEDNARKFDFLILATKNIPGNGPALVDIVRPAVTHSTTSILLLQNGLNIEKPFISAFPENVILSGISMMGSREIEPGVIRHIGHDSSLIGVFPGQRMPEQVGVETALHFCKVYLAAGKATCAYDDDVSRSRWRKLVYNASFNPICAITGMDTGSVRLADDAVEKLVRPAMEEIRTCAAAAGHELPEDIADKCLNFDPIEMHYVPSMLEDLRRGNLIEYENILGEPLKTAQKLGVPMPTISFLYSVCKTIQWKMKMEGSRQKIDAK